MGEGIVLAGTFSFGELTRSVASWLDRDFPGREVRTAPYGQVLESLHDSEGVLLTNTGVNVLLLRIEDLLRGEHALESTPERAGPLVDALLDALERAPAMCSATWLVAVLPASPTAGRTVGRWLDDVRQRIDKIVESVPGMYQVAVDDLPRRYRVAEVHDEYGDVLGHLPYSPEYLAALATWLVRLAATTWRRPTKVIVLDCDNTLWRGVVGEDGPLGVVVDEARQELQRFLRAQRAKGRLLCLASKNDQSDVERVFAEHPDMVLRLDEITAHRIGWQDKAGALVELAEQLRLKLDSFVFVDDDAVECAAVRETLPEVTVVELTRDPAAVMAQVEDERAFDILAVTEEDRLRADWYAAEPGREKLQRASVSYDEFLDRCAIVVELRDLEEQTLERAAQLTSRTTQFTLTGESHTVPELRSWLAGGGFGWTVRVRDRFGDYGTVGLVLCRRDDDELRVPVFVLSCRVLNRRVEREVVAHLRAMAEQLGCAGVRFTHRSTERNTPARAFLGSLTGREIGPQDVPGSVLLTVG